MKTSKVTITLTSGKEIDLTPNEMVELLDILTEIGLNEERHLKIKRAEKKPYFEWGLEHSFLGKRANTKVAFNENDII